ncbi:hypothetical protein Enr17x_45360 [Gimesia fumaroli]|uniref:Uncharacterized protein n=1 Tax=Gimesia fumaroli TaxID=2527976 RepID=A0A518IHA7_9PLAN|nr:hypothetical protein Enr17x_45360 [Gimesia fumaroli]
MKKAKPVIKSGGKPFGNSGTGLLYQEGGKTGSNLIRLESS